MRHIALTALLLLAGTVPAIADSIDGDWCGEKGARLAIKGPSIVTPGGATVTGQYRRHEFAYVVPAGEAGASSTIYMQLLDEEHMQSFTVKGDTIDPATASNWTRCNVTS